MFLSCYVLKIKVDSGIQIRKYLCLETKLLLSYFLRRLYCLELCAANLEQYFKAGYNGPMLPPDHECLEQLASGLNYIHSNHVVHLDIKPRKILISKLDSQEKILLKLSGFRESQLTREDLKFTVSQKTGTPNWIAPELLEIYDKMKDGVEKDGTISCDIFSLGCCFFYLLTHGSHPFGEDYSKIRQNIMEGNSLNLQGTIF